MNNLYTIEEWLSFLRNCFIDKNPELIALYDNYASEALYGRHFIESDLESLKPGSNIIEVGAGSLILSCQLIREGFHVTALEPIGTGFSHFTQMRNVVLEGAAKMDCLPLSLNSTAEALKLTNTFDYAFSINVMEHVNDIAKVINNITDSLKAGGSYHFTAPNSLFPYEPHFNLPTLFSKQLTERVFRKKILSCKKISCPVELWNSLNWINVIQIRKIVRQLPELDVKFNHRTFVTTVDRIVSDPIFARRHSLLIKKILMLLIKYHLHKLLRYIPVEFQPIMDCSLQKQSISRDYYP